MLLCGSGRGEIVPGYRLKDTDGSYRLKDTDGIMWYVVWWGNSLSFVLTVFSFGFRYFVFKGKEPAWSQRITLWFSAHEIFGITLWYCFMITCLIISTLVLTWHDITNVLLHCWFYNDVFKNEIFGLYFWDVTSWYQSLGLRDSDILSGVSELKLRNWYGSFQNEKSVL